MENIIDQLTDKTAKRVMDAAPICFDQRERIREGLVAAFQAGAASMVGKMVGHQAKPGGQPGEPPSGGSNVSQPRRLSINLERSLAALGCVKASIRYGNVDVNYVIPDEGEK